MDRQTAEWNAANEAVNRMVSLQQDHLQQHFAPIDDQHAAGMPTDTDVAMQLHPEELANFGALTLDGYPAPQMEEDNLYDQYGQHVQYDQFGQHVHHAIPEYEDGVYANGNGNGYGGDGYYLGDMNPYFDYNAVEGFNGGGDGMRACISCRERTRIVDLVQVPCTHDYCHGCVEQLFRNATADEALYPPRCCGQRIHLQLSEDVLPPAWVQAFREKEIEYSTADRTYCHQATCSAFVPPGMYVGSVATCRACQSTTCIVCKGPSHNGGCPRNEDLEGVIRLAREEGWQRCSNCRSMVELNAGCYHVTCRCGAQFCYLCGQRWKTCHCPQWDEQLLYGQAGVIHDGAHNDHGEVAVAEDPDLEDGRNRRFMDIVDDLRENHQCDHANWHYIAGRHVCEVCGRHMTTFIYGCYGCDIHVCRQCWHNRR
ncbi:hypothetical protein F4814DRAFT_444849 [Daldinia grandis]|nr:hypothetical protein F4814DRAFT_444849 [Daldinia grandis]